jgi:type IV pilus biogenesis protein CpaD/CtpE
MGNLKSRPKPAANAYYTMMKTRSFASCLLALATLVLSGCATDTTTTTTTTDQTRKRVHTSEELRKTGESETGPALEKVDPSVRTSGPR